MTEEELKKTLEISYDEPFNEEIVEYYVKKERIVMATKAAYIVYKCTSLKEAGEIVSNLRNKLI